MEPNDIPEDGPERDRWDELVDQWIAENVEGDPSWGEMADAQAWASAQPTEPVARVRTLDVHTAICVPVEVETDATGKVIRVTALQPYLTDGGLFSDAETGVFEDETGEWLRSSDFDNDEFWQAWCGGDLAFGRITAAITGMEWPAQVTP